jgi:carbon-monoxide dehydrogenase medium subunit
LIDVSRVAEMNTIVEESSRLVIGAAVPLKQVAADARVQRYARALAESTGQIGGPQVRAVGTLGGNVGHALPAGDGAISLLALGARATIASTAGQRQVPLLDLYKGPGLSTLQAGQEIIVCFDISIQQSGAGSAFARVMRPQGVALPVINMAAWLAVENGIIQQARVAVGPAGPLPRRIPALEQYLAGKTYAGEVLEEGRRIIQQEVSFRSSPLRASAAYRDHLSGVLLEKVLSAAYQRAVEADREVVK